MANIVLICAAGMSTSLMVSKMRKAAEQMGIECCIEATAVNKISNGRIGTDADIILLAPQVRFQETNVKKQFPDKHVEIIDMSDYGSLNGKKVMEKLIPYL